MAMNFTVNGLEELTPIAEKILANLATKVILLTGPMGAGKTTLIKALCKKLGVIDLVSSPTFSVVNEYFSPTHGTIYHFDWYRLEREEEALDLGLDSYLESEAFCFMEWPEKISNLLPQEFDLLHIEQEGLTRVISHKIHLHE
jgi:tRNA threonylcarbamoyladenosine biosynthesis protein TsaE